MEPRFQFTDGEYAASNPTLSALNYTHPEGWQSLAECTGLENQQGFIPFGGSNPSPSA